MAITVVLIIFTNLKVVHEVKQEDINKVIIPTSNNKKENEKNYIQWYSSNEDGKQPYINNYDIALLNKVIADIINT